MNIKRYALVGAVGAGKSTLFKALQGDPSTVMKTQAVEFNDQGDIDTPGEFISYPHLYNALINTVSDVDIIVYLHAANDPVCRLPAGLLTVYNHDVIAVITKTDLPEANIEGTKILLLEHGFKEPIFLLSKNNAENIALLKKYLIK